jgi:predicted histidine transporter YuiF (NhaC family)
MNMLLAVDQIPRLHNIFASFFTWILLAGYIVFPATFTSIQKAEGVSSNNHTENAIKDAILKTVKNVPLLWVAGACCILGGLGMLWLWFRWRDNYVWLINRIFL